MPRRKAAIKREILPDPMYGSEEIAKFIDVDSLEYLSQEGMLSVMKNSKDFCHACFSGEYPVKIVTPQDKYILEGKS